MSATVDERIVAAKFDASDFEKGVDKTIKKLDELKKSLNLKEATKSVQELAEKTEVSTDSMSKSLEKLTDRFTNFAGMIKQKILGGLADEVAGVFLKMEQSVKSFIKSISTDQIGAGLDKYQQLLTSVRVMVSSGVDETNAYESLEQLTEYVDQTSYSLTQMTDAMSKMVSAGVDVNIATKAVQGIANACADAGINAQDASRAFYNLAQAYSKGTLEYTDYKSLELLNMTTATFKDQLLEAAAEVGTLKKVSEGVYKTVNKVDKKVKAGKKVTRENMTDMMRYDFVNKDVMNKLFGENYYFTEEQWKEAKEKYNWDKLNTDQRKKALEDIKKEYGELKVQAYLAAKEARSFTDVMNTLKDAISTGWAKTFEHLFGKLEVAKDFFTDLTEGPLAEAIYAIGTWRNEVLESWNDLDAEGQGTGGRMFRESIMNTTDALGILFQTFESIAPDASEFGEEMKIMTVRVRNFTIQIKEAAIAFQNWMNEPFMSDGNGGFKSRIDVIRETLGHLGSVFGIFAKLGRIAFETIGKALSTLSPLFDGFLIFLNKVSAPLTSLKENTEVFKNIENSVDNILTVLQPIVNVLGEIVGFLGDVGAFFASMAIDTATNNIAFFTDALGLFLELFGVKTAQMKEGEGVLDKIRKDFEGIKSACQDGLSALKSFFGALLGDIRTLLGLTDETDKDNQNGGIFSNLIEFFDTNEFVQKAKKWVNQAIIDVGDFIKSIPERIERLGANIYDTLYNLFFTTKEEKNASGDLESKTILTPLGEWLSKVIEDIKEFVKSIPQRIIDGVGKIGDWINDVVDYYFGEKKTDQKKSKKDDSGKLDEKDSALISRFNDFLQTVVGSIRTWFEDLPNKIQNGLKGVGDFFTHLFNKFDEFLFGKKTTYTGKGKTKDGQTYAKKYTTRYKSGFSKWLDQFIKEINNFIKKIPEYIKAGIKGMGDIVTMIINALFGDPNENKEVGSADIEKRLEKPFLGIDLSNIINTIKEIGETILNQIARIFTGTDDVEANQQWFADLIANGIEWIREKAYKAVKWVLAYISSIPEKIANIFNRNTAENNGEQSPIGKAISDFGLTVGKFITEDLPTAILGFIDSAVVVIGDLWKKLYDAISGSADQEAEEASKEAVEEVDAVTGAAPQLTGWQKFVKKLGQTISHIFEELPVWIAQGVDLAIKGIKELVDGIGDWFEHVNIEEEAKKFTEKVTEGSEDFAENSEKTAEKIEGKESPLWTAVKNIGLSIYTLITETVPRMISEAWTYIGSKASEVWGGIESIFSGEIPEDDIGKAVNKVGTKIKDFLEQELPKKFDDIWKGVSSLASDIWAGISSLFTGIIPDTERGKAIANIVDSIQKFILNDVPNAISNLWNNTFNNKNDSWKKNIKSDVMYKEVVGAVENQQNQANDRLKRETEKTGFWSFVEGLKDSLLKALTAIGPSILTGLSTALDWVGKVATFIVDALTGKESVADQIEKAYGEEKPELRSALKKIGESLKNFFLDTIPKLIGSAIGALTKEMPNWFAKLFGAMGASAEEEGEKATEESKGKTDFGKAIENATGAMDIVKNIFNTLKNWVGENKDFLEIMGVLIALGMVFSKLSDLFGLADELDAGAETVKWAAITIAIAGLTGIMSFISQLVNEGDPNKIAKFEGILDKIGSLMEKVAWIVGLLSFGKIWDALGSKWEGGDGEKLNFSEKLLGGFADAITGFFKTIGVGAGTAIVGGAVNATLDTTFSTITSGIEQLSSGVETALSMIAPFVDTLVDLNTKLDQAIEAVQKIGNLFAMFMTAFGELYTQTTGRPIVGGNDGRPITNPAYHSSDEMKAFLKELSNRMNLFMQLSVFIEEVANAVGKLNNVSDLQGKIDEIAAVMGGEKFGEFLTNMLNTLNTAIKNSEIDPAKLGTTTYIMERNSGMALAFDVLASSLKVFADGVSGFDEASVNSFDRALDVINKIYGVIGDAKIEESPYKKAFFGDNSISKVGSELKMFGSNIKLFYDNIKDMPGFEAGQADITKERIDSITTFVKGIVEAVRDLNVYNSAQDFAFLTPLGEKLPGFATAISDFITNLDSALSKDISTDRSEVIKNLVDGVSGVLLSLGQLKYTSISSVIDGIWKDLSGDGSAKLAASMKLINDAIAGAMTNEEATEGFKAAGPKIAKLIFDGIQTAFNEDETLKPVITPVFDLDPAKDQLKKFFGMDQLGPVDFSQVARMAFGANDQTDEDRVKWSSLEANLGELKASVDKISENSVSISDVTSAFAGMKIITDTGVLAGEMTDKIDELIGRKIWLIQQGVTP